MPPPLHFRELPSEEANKLLKIRTLPASSGQNLALTVLHVPCSSGSGTCRASSLPRDSGGMCWRSFDEIRSSESCVRSLPIAHVQAVCVSGVGHRLCKAVVILSQEAPL